MEAAFLIEVEGLYEVLDVGGFHGADGADGAGVDEGFGGGFEDFEAVEGVEEGGSDLCTGGLVSDASHLPKILMSVRGGRVSSAARRSGTSATRSESWFDWAIKSTTERGRV